MSACGTGAWSASDWSLRARGDVLITPVDAARSLPRERRSNESNGLPWYRNADGLRLPALTPNLRAGPTACGGADPCGRR